MDYLDIAEIARRLGIPRFRARRLCRLPGFPAPTDQDGREVWSVTAVLRWAAAAGGELAARAPRLYQQVPLGEAAVYHGGTVVDGRVVLRWATSVGLVCVIYPTSGYVWQPPTGLLRLVPEAATVVAVRGDYDLGGPGLLAADQGLPGAQTTSYHVIWPDLARVFGMPAPWWPVGLRDPEVMLRWVPGAPTLVTPAVPDVDVAALLRLAADEPDGSTVQATLLHLVRAVQHTATSSAQHDLDILEGRGALPSRDREAIALAATPLPTARPAEDEDDPAELVVRDGWAQVLRRADMLAAACVLAAVKWDGGRNFPYSPPSLPIEPSEGVSAAEWAATLISSQRSAAFIVLDPDIMFTPGEGEGVELLWDPATDVPVLREVDDGSLQAAIPQRLPAVTPLAEVILEEPHVWVRTQDGRLYPAPQQPGAGLTWGYSGGGPATLALLLDRLLDDINAPAPSPAAMKEPPAGLLAGATGGWPEAGVVLSRAELLAARGDDRS